MRAGLFTLCLSIGLLFFSGGEVAAAGTPAPRNQLIAVVFMGSFEFQHPDYYKIMTDKLEKRFPVPAYKLVIGESPSNMFTRFCDKNGIFPEKDAKDSDFIKFAYENTFSQVLFIIVHPLKVRADDITVILEKPHTRLEGRAVLIDSRLRKKISDLPRIEVTADYGDRDFEKAQVLERLMDAIREKI